MLEDTYDIGRKGIHFPELSKIKYVNGEAPIKFCKKIYHHFMDNFVRSGDTVHFKNTQLTEDEKLTPSLLNFILFYTLENIDSRLITKVKDKWGHVLDGGKCLHDLKDIILKAVPDIILKLDTKDLELNAFNSSRKPFNQFSSNRRRGTSRQVFKRGNGKFCRLCQASGCSPRMFTMYPSVKDGQKKMLKSFV